MATCILVMVLLYCSVCGIMSRPVDSNTGGVQSDGDIVRSIIGETSSLEYRLTKWKTLEFYINTTQFAEPSKVVNAKLYMYKEPVRGRSHVPNTAEVLLLQLQQESDVIVVMSKISTTPVGWLSFDITNTVRHWIRDPATNMGLDVWLQTYSFNGHERKAISFRGPEKYTATKPTLVVRYDTHTSANSTLDYEV